MNITEIMNTKGTPTLKAIAAVFDVPTQRIYSVAKQPKEGEVYDAKASLSEGGFRKCAPTKTPPKNNPWWWC